MVHPVNVACACVGLLIFTTESYVPLVGAFAPAVPPFNVYAIVYVFAVHWAVNAPPAAAVTSYGHR